MLVFVSGFQEHQILLHWPARLARLTEQWSAKCTVERWGCIFFSVAPIVSDNAQLFRALHAQCLSSCPHILGANSQLDMIGLWFHLYSPGHKLIDSRSCLVLCLCVITDGDLRRNVGLEDWPSHQSSLSRGMWAYIVGMGQNQVLNSITCPPAPPRADLRPRLTQVLRRCPHSQQC